MVGVSNLRMKIFFCVVPGGSTRKAKLWKNIRRLTVCCWRWIPIYDIWNPCVGRTINQRVTMARQAMQAAVVKWTVLEVGRGQNRRNRLGSILEVPCIPSHDVWCSIVFSSVYIFLHGKEYTHIYTRYTKGVPLCIYAFCFDAFIFPHKTRLTKHRYITHCRWSTNEGWRRMWQMDDDCLDAGNCMSVMQTPVSAVEIWIPLKFESYRSCSRCGCFSLSNDEEQSFGFWCIFM